MLNQKDDVESAGTALFSIACGVIVVNVHPIYHFFSTTYIGLAFYISIIIVPIIVLCFLFCYRHKHPWNFFLLGIFTLYFGITSGLLCAFVDGKVVLETVSTTAAAVISLTIYTFWAAKSGHEFSFLAPFLLSVLIELIVFTIFQIFFPCGKVSEIICGGLFEIVFCAYIIYDTCHLIKKNTYDDYIWASVSLYLDIVNLFSHLLQVIAAVNRR
ncbi:hypothetical protein RD792_003323 [Penstemon davidsonii]|uniref:Uncharacterized protein n=1 Tax=Penstemon davidsonii TaxID=160366 RepID=A0ABR0DTI2_9LAMI|nr:hypothetical protein RD792_003323 [Penstemon davidsonii]